MRPYVLLFFIGFLSTHSSYSQQSKTGSAYPIFYQRAEILFNAKQATTATDSLAMIYYLRTADILETKNFFNDTLADSWLKCGILLMSGNDLLRAIQYFQKVIYLVHQHGDLSDSLLFKPYLYAGSVQYALNNLDSAVYYYKKAEVIYTAHPGLGESERLFNKFGALYFETGDYSKSISYFEKALALVREQSPANTFFIINYKNNIATALMKLGMYDQALKIFSDLLTYGNPPDELLYNTGNTYFEMGDYVQARKWLGLIRNMNFEKFTSLTKICIYLREYDSAQIYLWKAKGLYNAGNGGVSGVSYGIIQKYSGDLNRVKGNPIEGLFDYQKAILSLDQSFKDESLSANPTSFEGFQNFSFLFDALVAKAATLRSLGQQDIHFLEQSINAYESALTLAKHIEKTYFSDDARLFLRNKVNPATRDAVDVAIQLYYKTKNATYIHSAFSLVENNKATVLQAGIRNLELSSIPGLPTFLVAEEKKLRTLLAKLKIQAEQQDKLHYPDDLSKKIHDMEIALSSVQDKLDEDPVYHNLKFSGSLPDMDSLQQNINKADEAILSYYYTDSSLICFYITKDGSGFTSIPLQKYLFSSIISLRKELQQPEGSGRKYLKNAGTTLFENLISPVYEIIKDKKHLVIIPYNEISYVPFEMMVNPADGSLLLHDFSISYNYSANFLSVNKNEQHFQYQVLAMAPFSEKKNDLVLPALPASLEEIDQLPGKKISGAQATKMQFESMAGQFPIIHLATHAVTNDSNLLGTYIAFYGLNNQNDTLYRLYEQEIYTLDLKSARLVILSACETGNGMLVNGEGIMSLSRAFSYAGCKTVITSLWKADELSTTFIVKHLHNYLQKGLTVDDALRKAKIDYLESNYIEDRYKTPAYWAHLVLIGNVEPVINRKLSWPVEMALIILFILLTWLVIKKTRHKNMSG
jgi:CHAT domain-containing protein/Tfp pilus assembly protein PilF